MEDLTPEDVVLATAVIAIGVCIGKIAYAGLSKIGSGIGYGIGKLYKSKNTPKSATPKSAEQPA